MYEMMAGQVSKRDLLDLASNRAVYIPSWEGIVFEAFNRYNV